MRYEYLATSCIFALFLTNTIFGQNEGITVKQNNIGIGTIDPQSVLHINGQVASELILEFDDTIGGFGEFQLRDQNAKKWSIGAYRNSAGLPNSFYIYQYTDSTNSSVDLTRLSIDNTGKLGIGTNNPNYNLHNYSSSGNINTTTETADDGNANYRLKNAGLEWTQQVRTSSFGNRFRLRDVTNSKDVFEAIPLTGDVNFLNNVGLGTYTPSGALHIYGAGNKLSYIESTDGNAVQLRLKSNSSNNRRLIGESASQVKSQISLEDSDLRIYGATTATNPMNIKTDGSNNVGFNQVSSFGTAGTGLVGIGRGNAPTSSPADMVQLYVDDVNSSAELLVRDESGQVTILSNPSQLNYVQGSLSSDVSITSVSTWFNGPSVTLSPGTWLVTCTLSFHKGALGLTDWYGRISTGSVHYSGGITRTDSANPQRTSLSMTSVIVVSTTTTVYGQGASSSSGSGVVLIRAKVNLSGLFDVSTISAVKIG